jgi:hypothetical protein
MTTNQITINDLASVCEIINVCNKRGAFLLEEFEPIGKLYNKLKLFIKENSKESDVNDKNVENNIQSKTNTSPSPLSQVESADDQNASNVN